MKRGAGNKKHKAYCFRATVPRLYRPESNRKNQSTRLWHSEFAVNRQQQWQENGADRKTTRTAY
eukprot:35877-Heterocapsa_arctica.AAC.1